MICHCREVSHVALKEKLGGRTDRQLHCTKVESSFLLKHQKIRVDGGVRFLSVCADVLDFPDVA